jgi:hypothetical protein
MNVGEIICSGGRHRAFPSPHLLCRPQADLARVVGFILLELLTPLRAQLASKSPIVQSYFNYDYVDVLRTVLESIDKKWLMPNEWPLLARTDRPVSTLEAGRPYNPRRRRGDPAPGGDRGSQPSPP